MKQNVDYTKKRGVLGFRTKKVWKMRIAILFYAVLIIAVIATIDSEVNTPYLLLLGVILISGFIFPAKIPAAQNLCSTTSASSINITERQLLQKLQAENAILKASVSPEMQDVATLRGQTELLQQKLAELQRQIIVAEDTIEMEQFGLYRPKYALTCVQEYKDKLDEIRTAQKQMIKDRTAATCSIEWTVNGSKKEGRKQTTDTIKLMLRAFNDECEAAIASVKFNNYDRCAERINKSFDDCNKLGTVQHICISSKYLKLKIAELQLSLEYAQQKQKEKEEQAEIRRQQREQAKLEKEIAEARKAAEKERLHYEQALSNLDAQIFTCADPVRKTELEAKRAEVQEGLDTIQTKLEDIDYRQSNQRAGYVYIISNIGAFGKDVYKIGMTRRLDPMERVDELGDASVPFEFDVHAMIFSADAPALENALHRAFHDKRINKVNNRREYFRVTLDEIKQVIRANHDQAVEFINVPLATQYRESIQM